MDSFEERFAGLIARAREGDALAWGELYREVAPLVTGYLRAQRLPDPDDVAGEVMVELVRGIGRFRGDAAGFRSWALVIAHHRLIDARRRDARRPATPTDLDEITPPSAPDDVEQEVLAGVGLERLEPALAALTDDQRTVLLLRVIGDLSVADVARAIGKRPGAVKQLQHRATQTMRRTLDDEAGSAVPSPTTDMPSPTAGQPGLPLGVAGGIGLVDGTHVRAERIARDPEHRSGASRGRWRS